MIKINGIVLEQKNFPDNTLLIKAPEVGNTVTITWLYENDAELFTLQCLVDKWEDKEKILIMPYCPHARMDRVKNEEDVFTLKTFCNIINCMMFDQVLICDPHSDVCTALLDRVIVSSAIGLSETCGGVVFYPDNGAEKRYSGTEKHTYGIKKRNWETGKIESLIIAEPEVVRGEKVYIIDDICSYGGTFVRAAQALRAAGATEVDLVVTHCEKSILKGDIFKEGNVDKVYTTNSLIQQEDIPKELKDRLIILEEF